MSARIVVTGAGGQLGGCLAAQAVDQGRSVLALTSAQWDITDPAAAEAIVTSGDVVINCGAYTNVDGAESDEARAYAVNEAAPEHIARACARAGARLIHVSTDFVFAGDFGGAQPRPYEPSDETSPRGVYACSKRAGEVAVLAALPEAVVVRTAWVYTGGTGSDFVAIMRKLAAGDGPIKVVDDQVGSPTYVADLAEALLQVADDGVPGPILHAANEGVVSRFGLARAVFEECGADPERVNPVGTDEFPRPAPRPTYSALSGRQSAAAGMAPLRPWRPALVAALAASQGPVPAERPIISTRD
ncbi:dTDP-4-dehydrorhamnose reductase [Mycobacterium montefiorense]|uniref:dTDP-4-dehydrorhamnose reductase n=1 Tax=Mycobacterium montefiorense TaxID=154654 RepID=A0AA37USA7_9MYCO|nr:dTDP-4-dehydrorhamnose reductase [Mycobacterium montefiorense]GBG37031.1 NAD(P)-dependent oxidoreductase [Mycobacterium montefiorense]GKU36776.1 NAD(P)-dependent oxidoreductase [Mycobacterium montefiorense]GKU42895.1 NAD(P)-dependent oxidoreductase [Mycobacterium montefiorense]GKU48335.1 NAD(P)-dependent oxidoreductase [Mycobacterium montefiorense]GKU50836.1 NAD(P)-dependent oxidoreductase [Mycobacterium montefiorense]